MYVASYFISNVMSWYEQRALVMSKTRNTLQVCKENKRLNNDASLFALWQHYS